MSFVSEFKTIIESDASINEIVTGGIKFGHLPEDFDIRKVWIAWDYEANEQTNDINNNNVFTIYQLFVTLTATDTVVLNNLVEMVKDLLNDTMTGNFIDINFVDETKTTLLGKQVNSYQSQLTFNALFLG